MPKKVTHFMHACVTVIVNTPANAFGFFFYEGPYFTYLFTLNTISHQSLHVEENRQNTKKREKYDMTQAKAIEMYAGFNPFSYIKQSAKAVLETNCSASMKRMK